MQNCSKRPLPIHGNCTIYVHLDAVGRNAWEGQGTRIEQLLICVWESDHNYNLDLNLNFWGKPQWTLTFQRHSFHRCSKGREFRPPAMHPWSLAERLQSKASPCPLGFPGFACDENMRIRGSWPQLRLRAHDRATPFPVNPSG